MAAILICVSIILHLLIRTVGSFRENISLPPGWALALIARVTMAITRTPRTTYLGRKYLGRRAFRHLGIFWSAGRTLVFLLADFPPSPMIPSRLLLAGVSTAKSSGHSTGAFSKAIGFTRASLEQLKIMPESR